MLVITFETFAQEKPGIRAFSKEQLISAGSKIYQPKCARCHGRKGQGQFNGHDAAPKLRGNYANLATEEITSQVTRGSAYIPKFDYLSDQDIPAVATYIRNSFGNQLGIANVQEINELCR
ncbi:MAG: cytochrome c [Deltaproteobacteria bacterium]|nr:cytochrome c [Deltaproteobacteria bacterium]MBT7204040.1 cytochrome c [Deltaproteobacteria bacterium]